jgi:hypothetical protein
MGEWASYTLSDFVMFSPQAYARLLERYNLAWWPLQLAFVAAGASLFALARTSSPRAAKSGLVILAAAWLFTGWAFHWRHYAEIFLAAPWLAAACWAQAALLLACCFARPLTSTPSLWRNVPGSLLLLAGLLYPLLAPLAGKPWPQAESFGAMPDPTALATLGYWLLAPIAWPWRGLLAVIPAASFVVGMATRWTLAQ